MDAIDGLWPENAHAWRVYHQIVSRFGIDFGGVTAWLLDRVTDGMDPEDAVELVERLALIYDTLNPAPSTDSKAE
jgi:hypothetical protein